MGVLGAPAEKRDSRMTDSKSGSKDNLNESNMPLLEGEEKAEETPEKEEVEMGLEEKEEKKDDSTEKDKKEKKVKEKKVKVPKVKKEPGPSCIDTLSSGLDLGARDTQGINVEIDLDDVIAEPKAAHGFDPVWRLSFILFSQTKLWTYRILAALLAAPLSILWGLLFRYFFAFYVIFLLFMYLPNLLSNKSNFSTPPVLQPPLRPVRLAPPPRHADRRDRARRLPPLLGC